MSELCDILWEAYEGCGEQYKTYTQPILKYIREHPKSTLALAFLAGIICGGILQSDIAKLLIVTLAGGVPGAISLGTLMGMHPVTCALIAVATNFVVAAAAINFLYFIEKEPKVAMIVNRIRGRFSGFLEPFMRFAGEKGVFLSIVLFTFGIGLTTVFIVDLIKADIQDAKKAILLGLVLAAVFWIIVYQVLVTVIPPTVVSMVIVAAILLMVFYSRIREWVLCHLKGHPA